MIRVRRIRVVEVIFKICLIVGSLERRLKGRGSDIRRHPGIENSQWKVKKVPSLFQEQQEDQRNELGEKNTK